jgi:hypothetical protein
VSNPLSDSSSASEVIAAIRSGQVLRFSDIPEHLMSGEAASDWLALCFQSKRSAEASFAEVPVSCRTPMFMALAAKMRCPVLKDLLPEQYVNYRGLAERAISATYSAISDLDERFRDQQMVDFIVECWPNYMHTIAKRYDWVLKVMPDDLLNKCAYLDPMFALRAPHDRLREPLFRYMSLALISKNIVKYREIRDTGRIELLAAKVSEGEWFHNYKQHGGMRRPGSLAEAVNDLDSSRFRLYDEETMLMAYIMSYPIEQVVPAMKSHRLKKLLFEMYSQEALEPFLKTDFGLKGVMLEMAMGL